MTREPRSHRPQFSDLDDWVTPRQAKVYLGISRSLTYELLRQGQIRCKKFGRKILIPKAALAPQVIHEGEG